MIRIERDQAGVTAGVCTPEPRELQVMHSPMPEPEPELEEPEPEAEAAI